MLLPDLFTLWDHMEIKRNNFSVFGVNVRNSHVIRHCPAPLFAEELSGFAEIPSHGGI